jgi:glycosyltransferase involved in cell wall biosynthesis
VKLSALNYYPILNLTITDNYGNLIERINKLNKAGVKVRNFGFTNINELFSHSTHLIYPSLKESFGLGLVEGVHSGLKIIGADLPYTYEVVKPSLTFSPYNSDDLVSKLIRVLDNEISMEDSEIVVENRINQLLKNLLK